MCDCIMGGLGGGADENTTYTLESAAVGDGVTEHNLIDSAGVVVGTWTTCDDCTHTTLDSFESVVDEATGEITITVTLSDGSTGDIVLPAPPDDIYVTAIDSASVSNADGSTTTTWTVTLSDGTTLPFTYDHLPSAAPTALVVDPAAGTVTITYTNPDGSTFDLVDTVPPFADTNTTNTTFVYDPATGDLTITDSDGNALAVNIPPSYTSSFAAPVTNADGTITYTHNDGNGNTTDIITCPVCAQVVDADGNSLEDPDNPGTFVIPTGGGTASSVTTSPGAPAVHDDGNGNTVTISALDNQDGTADILGCKVSNEKITLCIDETPGVAVHTKRITDLKTGVETDFVYSAHSRSVNTFNGFYAVDDTITVGPPNFDVITPAATMPAWGCPTLTGTIRLYMQLNADANPIGAPAENLNFRYRINGGGWLAMQPLTSYSPTIIGIAGATGSNQTNQELIITGARYDVAMPAGATLEFGVAATNPFDPGEGLQLQAVWGAFEYVDLECEIK